MSGIMPAMRWQTAWLLSVGLGLGCASGTNVEAVARDGFDGAYLKLRAESEGCTAARAGCCPELAQRLVKARAAHQMQEVASTLDALAIACPAQRAQALAALDHRPPEPATGEPVTVTYVLELGPEDRLYWLGAFVDGTAPPRSRVTPGAHSLEVEAHVMTTGPVKRLYTLRGQKQLTTDPEGKALVVIKRVSDKPEGNPFALLMPDAWKGLAAGSVISGESKRLLVETPRPKTVGDVRYPSELRRAGTKAVTLVCVNEQGKVHAVQPLSHNHPRYLASLVDALFHSEYPPHQLEGRAVPSCHLMSITWE
jgi:hypothetical protein